MTSAKTTSLAVAAAALLAACGGSDYGSVTPPPPPPPPPAPVTAVPDSAIASSGALVSYLQAQKADDEMSDALTLPSADAAVSETDEPQSL
ncbi:MAG: hypothetical protein EKK53_02660 [Burkholderiales bacterium]|nr:MAG: hypothetical protein EKK53_02660 [Burkholderiales bacterium]